MLEPGWTTKAKVINIIDGDTIEVEIKRTFNIRLRGIDICEKNTSKGQAAKRALSDEILDDYVTIFIPTNNPEKLMDINSFERLIGDVYVGDRNIKEFLQDYKK